MSHILPYYPIMNVVKLLHYMMSEKMLQFQFVMIAITSMCFFCLLQNCEINLKLKLSMFDEY